MTCSSQSSCFISAQRSYTTPYQSHVIVSFIWATPNLVNKHFLDKKMDRNVFAEISENVALHNVSEETEMRLLALVIGPSNFTPKGQNKTQASSAISTRGGRCYKLFCSTNGSWLVNKWHRVRIPVVEPTQMEKLSVNLL